MNDFVRFCLICGALCIFLSGCATTNASQMVSNRLDPEMLNSKLETQTIDLSVDSKCQETKSVRVVSIQERVKV